MDGELNHVGCQYGRENRDTIKRLELSVAVLSTKHEKIEDSVREIQERVEEVMKKTYWILGAFAFVGSLFGSIFGVALKLLGH